MFLDFSLYLWTNPTRLQLENERKQEKEEKWIREKRSYPFFDSRKNESKVFISNSRLEKVWLCVRVFSKRLYSNHHHHTQKNIVVVNTNSEVVNGSQVPAECNFACIIYTIVMTFAFGFIRPLYIELVLASDRFLTFMPDS